MAISVVIVGKTESNHGVQQTNNTAINDNNTRRTMITINIFTVLIKTKQRTLHSHTKLPRLMGWLSAVGPLIASIKQSSIRWSTATAKMAGNENPLEGPSLPATSPAGVRVYWQLPVFLLSLSLIVIWQFSLFYLPIKSNIFSGEDTKTTVVPENKETGHGKKIKRVVA